MAERKILIRNIKYIEHTKMHSGLYVALVVGDDDMIIEEKKDDSNN
mgnify:CR=1 FL=1